MALNPRAADGPRPRGASLDGYSSQEDDAPTRVYTKRGTFSPETLPEMVPATTKEREEREREDDKRKLPSYFVRDFGHKVSPGYEDVLRMAGRRTDSVPLDQTMSTNPNVPDTMRPQVMEIMHNWTQEVEDDEFVATINILAPTRNTSGRHDTADGNIVWLHVEDPLPSLEKLERYFASHLAKRVQLFVGKTTASLLERVRTTRERKLVSGTLGRFLLPGLVRYSARSNDTGNEDHPLLFLNFPYLALGRFAKATQSVEDAERASGPRSPGIPSSGSKARGNAVSGDMNGQPVQDPEAQKTEKAGRQQDGHDVHDGDDEDDQQERDAASAGIREHPPRTLLQSRYRLESTKKRDRNHAILTLSQKQLRECITRPSKKRTKPHPPARTDTQDSLYPPGRVKKQKREKLHIPQLWSLSLSGDVMMTYGPISLDDLCSSALSRKEFDISSNSLRHLVVRFIVMNDTAKEDVFIYPAERCEWYFGLMNKQRKVEATLSRKKDNPSTSADKTSPALPLQRQPTGKVTLPDDLQYTLIYRSETNDIGTVVDCDNWLDLQSRHEAKQLDLHMENRKNPAITVDTIPPQLPEDSMQSIGNSLSPRQNAHGRSQSDSNVQSPAKSTRDLLSPQSAEARGRSATSSRSASPGSTTSRLKLPWSDNHARFFEWPFLEEVSHSVKLNVRRTDKERVEAWLLKCLYSVYRIHAPNMNQELKPQKLPPSYGRIKTLTKIVSASSHAEVVNKYFKTAAPDVIRSDPQVSRLLQVAFATLDQLLKLFVPDDMVKKPITRDREESDKMIYLYWGLVDCLLEAVINQVSQTIDISTLAILDRNLKNFLDHGQQIHRGTWKMVGEKKDPTQVDTVESAVIYMPIALAFERMCTFLFDVIHYAQRGGPPSSVRFAQATADSVSSVTKAFGQAERFLIQGGDESRYQKSLGPIVTPEGITILLLRRISRGVFRDGTINVIEAFERVVERLALKVENSATRFLLLEINRVSEEIDIVLETLHQQKNFLSTYRDYLDPSVIENPSIKRQTRFEYEENGIKRLMNEVEERIRDCEELLGHVNRLADQNLQLVEGGQDDLNKKLMLFTIVTIIFLPLSFVASFFGMNVVGINPTTSTTTHFWVVAVPTTVGVLLVSLTVLYKSPMVRFYNRVKLRLTTDEFDDE